MYFYVDNTYQSEIEVKKSKFISYITPYKEYETLYNKLVKDHPKATHIIWAYRYLNEYHQIVENCTDDNEPKGVAGKPTLKVLQGKDIINSAIITIRYFGGTKLGMGGMVRGYSDSANEVMKIANFLQYKELKTKKIVVQYNNLSKIEYLANKCNITIIDKEFFSDVIITIEYEEEYLLKFEKELGELYGR